jgi:hypothetical protein
MPDLSALQTKDNIVNKYEKLLSREARIGTVDLKSRSRASLLPSHDYSDNGQAQEDEEGPKTVGRHVSLPRRIEQFTTTHILATPRSSDHLGA